MYSPVTIHMIVPQAWSPAVWVSLIIILLSVLKAVVNGGCTSAGILQELLLVEHYSNAYIDYILKNGIRNAGLEEPWSLQMLKKPWRLFQEVGKLPDAMADH